MPRPQPLDSSAILTLLFCIVLVLALFPDAFYLAWSAPLSVIFGPSSIFASPSPSNNPASITTDVNMWTQKQFSLQPKSRGSYLITNQIVQALPEIREYKVGLLNLFIQHTSCALSLNENCEPTSPAMRPAHVLIATKIVDEDVREDMSDALDRIAPEEGPKGEALYRHEYGLSILPLHSLPCC